MNDLVGRLRSYHHLNFAYDDAQEAAARIEALEAALLAPVAYRIYCTNNGTTGYLYTEALPFHPGPGIKVRREPEPLFTGAIARAALNKDA